jgi:hypothetical protein
MACSPATLAVTGFVPDIELPSARSGSAVRLNLPAGQTTVLVTVHSARCAGCQEYVSGLAPASGEFEVWEGRLLVVVPEPPGAARQMQAPFGQVLSDEAGRVADPGSASVIVADRYGHIFQATHAAASHQLPPVRELEEWLKYLGTLCPE